MIIGIAVMLIAGLILAVGWWVEIGKNKELERELAELRLPDSKPKSEEEPETGHFVKAKKMRPASPETYRNVFDLDINGQRVLDHLELVFAKKSTYVRGGQDAERESCFRAGQAHVIGFIFNQINKANNPEFYKDEVDD
jgi:hypothetical protein